MAIAPSKLGRFVLREWDSDTRLLNRLREANLVKSDASDKVIMATFNQARQEHLAFSEGQRQSNSPHERVRVFLKPYLTRKGRNWAVPLKSLSKFWILWRTIRW